MSSRWTRSLYGIAIPTAALQRRVCLLAPDLFGPLIAAGADAAGREALLAGLSLKPLEESLCRADAALLEVAGDGFEALLAAVFGLGGDADACCPIAALSRQMDMGDAGDQIWLRADPVHVRAALAEATLLHHSGPPPGLHLSDDEAQSLLAVVNAALVQESLTLEASHAGRWYLRLAAIPDARFVSPYELAGGSLRDRLPSGPEGARWRRVLTETQTALFECPTNNARERVAAPVINSLWFFGPGRLPAPLRKVFAGVCGNHELAQALACHAGSPARALPDDARHWVVGPGRR